LWLGLRSVFKHRRGPLVFINGGESGRNKIAKRFEETHKVKRRMKNVKREQQMAISNWQLAFVS
jgi:hypothetical protein